MSELLCQCGPDCEAGVSQLCMRCGGKYFTGGLIVEDVPFVVTEIKAPTEEDYENVCRALLDIVRSFKSSCLVHDPSETIDAVLRHQELIDQLESTTYL